MSDLYWLTDEQMARPEPFFPKSHGKPRVDDRRVLSRIIFINRNGLHWRDAPEAYGPHKTFYNHWKHWGAMGVFVSMMKGLTLGKDVFRARGIRACVPGRNPATASRSCLEGSGTGDVSAMRYDRGPPSSSQPSVSLQPWCSGYEALA